MKREGHDAAEDGDDEASSIEPARLLDTHCHLDAFSDPLAVLASAAAAGVDVVAVTEDPGGFRMLRTRLGPRAGVHPALGCHPLRVASLAAHDLARFFRQLPLASWIGEIGLDFGPVGAPSKRRQLQVFEAILAEPVLTRRPVTVHSRGAQQEVIARLAQAGVPAVLHWFTGSADAAEKALAAGLWFSVNRAMTRSPRGADLLRGLPHDRVVLETDGPYCRDGGRPHAPQDLEQTVSDLARIWKLPLARTRTTIVENQNRLLSAALFRDT